MSARLLVALVLAAAGVFPARAAAEPRSAVSLGLALEVGGEGFRLAGRLTEPGGTWGAWVTGRRRPDGLALDGRLQRPGRAFDFRLEAGPAPGLEPDTPAPPGAPAPGSI